MLLRDFCIAIGHFLMKSFRVKVGLWNKIFLCLILEIVRIAKVCCLVACPIYVSVLTLRFKKVTSCRFAQNSSLQMSHFVFGSHLGLNLADASLAEGTGSCPAPPTLPGYLWTRRGTFVRHTWTYVIAKRQILAHRLCWNLDLLLFCLRWPAGPVLPLPSYTFFSPVL